MNKTDIQDYTKNLKDDLKGIYRGVIEDNNDPDKLGRCKIRIIGLHSPNKITSNTDGIPTEELPWGEPCLGLFEGSVTGFGAWVVPLQGSHVFVFFEAGHILKPRYFASIPGKPTDQNHGFDNNQGFSDPDKIYPNKTTNFPYKPNQLNESDYHRLARNENISETIVQDKNNNRELSIEKANGAIWNEPTSYYNAEYPHNKVFATHSGITIEIDDTENNERIHIYHPSNTFIEIDKDGNVNIKTNKTKSEIIKESNRKYIKQNKHLTIGQNNTKNIGGTETKFITSNRILFIGGNSNTTIVGKTDVNSLNSINMDAPMIYLNSGQSVFLSPK